MKLYVFDDGLADEWHPFSLSRPCSELLFGTVLQRERLERFAGTASSGLISRPWLASFSEDRAPPVVADDAPDPETDRLYLSSRAVPDPAVTFERPKEATTLEIDGEVVGAYLPGGSEGPDGAWLKAPAPLRGGRALVIEGVMLRHTWDLVDGAADRVARDLSAGLTTAPEAPGSLPGERLGDGKLSFATDVRVEPGVLFDLRDGPICLARGVEVRAGTRLSGPLYAGPASRLLGGSISRLSAGPCSYLRGEIEESVVLGYSNKAHDGFLGHAYVGRWANLGALTTNSDLKNNYGTVRLATSGGEVDTQLVKFGCLIGDHAKTAIGTLITTGGVIGCGANVFGAAPPKWVPPFSWGDAASVYRLESFLETARTVMVRRGVSFGGREDAWLTAVWEAGTAYGE